MYQYEYETVSCDLEGWGFGSGNIYSIEDYRSIISERAKEGWRYVGCIPIKQRGTGHIQEMDLILRKNYKNRSKKKERVNDLYKLYYGLSRK